MLIVLEGCDGTGKTTLAHNLSKILGAEIIHCTTDTPNTVWFFRDIIEMAQTRNIIADRFCYGQFVYQSEDKRQLTKHDLYNLELAMLNTGARVVYVDCDEQVLNARLAARNEVPMKPIRQLKDGYLKVFSDSLLKIAVVDTTKSTDSYVMTFNKTRAKEILEGRESV